MKVPSPKTILLIVHDVVVVCLSFYLALSMRHEQLVPPPLQDTSNLIKTFSLIVVIQFVSFASMGLYKAIIRFSSIPDLVRIIKGTLVAVPFSFFGLFFFNRLEGIHRSSFFLDWIFLIIGLSASRLAYRLYKDNAANNKRQLNHDLNQRVLIVGAGVAGEKLLREFQTNQDIHFHIIGFVDDNPRKIGKSIRGTPIYGPISSLRELIKEYKIKTVLLTMPSATGEQVKTIISQCLEVNAQLKILPKLSDIIGGKITYSKLRNVEPGDLLGRKAHDLDVHNMSKLLHNKTILVTGAGGSIGSELCKQISHFEPRLLVLFEMTELFLYELETTLRVEMPSVRIQPVIGDIRNLNKLKEVFATYRPEIVFHAAAYKHVPLMEHNPLEAIKTNVLGTYNLASTASEFGADKFVCISTDKAINPTNVMGSSKRIAELICQNFQQHSDTKFITVRFGNVLGSSGSVIPIFKKQIEKGGPIEVTHPDMKRYFMSIPEATQLVIQAGALGEGGEIMVLDMGQPMKIVDLATEMITLAGMVPGKDIEIKFTGLRPGEKLFEELFHEGDTIKETNHPLVKIATTLPPQENFDQLLKYLITLPEKVSADVIRDAIKSIVPEYKYESPAIETEERPH